MVPYVLMYRDTSIDLPRESPSKWIDATRWREWRQLRQLNFALSAMDSPCVYSLLESLIPAGLQPATASFLVSLLCSLGWQHCTNSRQSSSSLRNAVLSVMKRLSSMPENARSTFLQCLATSPRFPSLFCGQRIVAMEPVRLLIHDWLPQRNALFSLQRSDFPRKRRRRRRDGGSFGAW